MRAVTQGLSWRIHVVRGAATNDSPTDKQLVSQNFQEYRNDINECKDYV